VHGISILGIHDKRDQGEEDLDLDAANGPIHFIDGDEEPTSEAEVDALIERDALADPSPQWPADCHRVKVRLNNCDEAKHHNCFVGSICCGRGCDSINVFEKLPLKTKTGKRDAEAGKPPPLSPITPRSKAAEVLMRRLMVGHNRARFQISTWKRRQNPRTKSQRRREEDCRQRGA
ncbi:MAG: hypothetical protein Q9183_007790, partial [Haloplaca sp. 2 TL-2023]